MLSILCYPYWQEELEAYDRHQRLLEDQLDGKTAELIGEMGRRDHCDGGDIAMAV